MVKHLVRSGRLERVELERLSAIEGLAAHIPRVLHASDALLVLERMPGVPLDSSTELLLHAPLAFDAGAKLRLIHGGAASNLGRDVRVHGDYAPSNLLSVGEAVSAILDPAPNGYWTTAFGSRRPAGEETANYLFCTAWRLHRRNEHIQPGQWWSMADAFHAGYGARPDKAKLGDQLSAHARLYLQWRLPAGARAVAQWRWSSWLRQAMA